MTIPPASVTFYNHFVQAYNYETPTEPISSLIKHNTRHSPFQAGYMTEQTDEMDGTTSYKYCALIMKRKKKK